MEAIRVRKKLFREHEFSFAGKDKNLALQRFVASVLVVTTVKNNLFTFSQA